MIRNSFIARFVLSKKLLVGDVNPDQAIIVNQTFVTQNLYQFAVPDPEVPITAVATNLELPIVGWSEYFAETNNGTYVTVEDGAESGWQSPGIIQVGFNIVEDGTSFVTLDNPVVRGFASSYSMTQDNNRVAELYEVHSYAIGILGGTGAGPTVDPDFPNYREKICWVVGSEGFGDSELALASLKVQSLTLGNSFAFGTAFLLPIEAEKHKDVIFTSILNLTDPGDEEPVGDCCTSQSHSNAINAAAILVASNNATTPSLIKKIEDAVSNNFDLPSTLSALQSMRQMGTLSNMTGKVLDNLVWRDVDADFNIKNGKEAK